MTKTARETATPVLYRFADDGKIPNNPRLPLLHYVAALPSGEGDLAAGFERMFAANGWEGSWRNGIYHYHHFHSTAHEVLGIAKGTVNVRLGGPGGDVARLHAGDVVVIPAGVGHKNEGASADLLVVGAYPNGQEPDLLTGKAGEHDRAVERIAAVAMPSADPVHGKDGPLRREWHG